MPIKLDAPIPGQSLTMEPGNAPWEQPPLYADSQQALAFHLEKLSDEEKMDDLLFLLDQGFPLNVLVETMTTMGVMEGIHTVDVSVLISPVIHEYLVSLAEAADIKVVENDGPTKEDRDEDRRKQRYLVMIQKALDESGGESDVLEDMMSTVETNSVDNEEVVKEESVVNTGIIPRRDK